MQEDSDDALMRRAGSGDKAAFALLVRRHLARATALAQRITGNRSDAEEIVQEAFLRCWQKAPEWRPVERPANDRAANDRGEDGARAQFGTWLYRVLVNLCLDRRRRPQPVGIEAAETVADSAADGFDETARGETSRRVQAAMAQLPERQRAALALCYFEGLGNIEAAATLDISIGALESLLVRARRALRDALGDLAEEGGAG
ncbi:MAG TPA: sigma-70 family RNA polymerase sigma factor [Dongiaceae bacterium]|jgi:RNA polymerase sigma-70 factor (ECF subfamily)|nr:sigma-70 family RNA polymerase sigma factor [Dongiaceae bacterium]